MLALFDKHVIVRRDWRIQRRDTAVGFRARGVIAARHLAPLCGVCVVPRPGLRAGATRGGPHGHQDFPSHAMGEIYNIRFIDISKTLKSII